MSGTRPLTDRERELLEFLLATEFEGAEALRAQMAGARARQDGINDPTFVILEVDEPSPARQDGGHGSPMVETQTREGYTPAGDLILFVKDGRLAVLELVVHDGSRVAELPPSDIFQAPWPGRAQPRND
jgi:hypothetical protein